ncbi:MAG: bifunctional glutamate N-acetyltransferase/amino-acid acetyltransferase ArgJ [Kiritimatiellae bacterium]|nr:bifunctional glutamate N-acetyltransferase/amino-acid acetyltransferase ArgJ [Kiritimatiellia bacterium]
MRLVEGGVCAAKGFRAAGVPARIKYEGRRDVALIVADAPCAAAAVFTTNAVAAAPVVYDRAAVKGGRIQAILANSGCANACTGEAGRRDAERSAIETARTLGIDPGLVLVASTGVIGHRLPMDRLLDGMRCAAAALAASPEAALDANRAVMTTDTKPKQAAAQVRIGGRTVTVGGMCKGSGMIEPNMATMLGFITTDAAISPTMLRRALRRAIAVSFNHVVVDGDESTNDSVFLLASGVAGNARISAPGRDMDLFTEALTAVGVALAKQMAADGEGATKFVSVTVKGARTPRDAERAARAIAKSPLAKTSWFGKDPNWGRVLAAAGYSGAAVDDRRAEVFYGRTWAYRKGRVADAAQLEWLARELEGPELSVTVDLHLGEHSATIYTCDLSLDYVHINADYTT